MGKEEEANSASDRMMLDRPPAADAGRRLRSASILANVTNDGRGPILRM